jgi:hypothetical protein
MAKGFALISALPAAICFSTCRLGWQEPTISSKSDRLPPQNEILVAESLFRFLLIVDVGGPRVPADDRAAVVL